MRNYRWAKDRWPNRTIHVTTYESHNTLTILKPGFSFNTKRKRRIIIDNNTLVSELERTNLIKPPATPNPKRGI